MSFPLHDLKKKKFKFQCTMKHDNAFTEFKERIMMKPLLIFPNFNKPFKVHCDACGDSVRVFLSQEGHTIAYEVKSPLSPLTPNVSY